MEKIVGFLRRDLPPQTIVDADFSEIGRDLNRYPPGWYVPHAIIIGCGALLGLATVLAHITGIL